MATITMHDPHGGPDIVAEMGPSWQDLPSHKGVRVYHVPDPDDPGVLHATMFKVAPGSHYEGSVIDDSQLIGILKGGIRLDNKLYLAGQMLWLAPGQPTSWSCEHGATGVVQYNVPPPDLDLVSLTQIPLRRI